LSPFRIHDAGYRACPVLHGDAKFWIQSPVF
jgi:hypothetical protein